MLPVQGRNITPNFADIDNFIRLDEVERCISRGVAVRLRFRCTYRAFIDPSGVGDGFTCAIGHRDGDKVVIDRARA